MSRTTVDQFMSQQQHIARGQFHQNPRAGTQMAEHTFPGERAFLPPPEKWTENEYARYEEPLMQRKSKVVSESPAHTSKTQTPKTREESVIVAARPSTCQLVGKRFTIEKGTQVQIQEALPRLKCYRISHKGQSGIFPMRDFK